MKETEKTVSNKGSEKEPTYSPTGDCLRVFFYLRRRSDTFHTVEDISEGAKLQTEVVRSALKMIRHHPLVETKAEKDREIEVGFFRLMSPAWGEIQKTKE